MPVTGIAEVKRNLKSTFKDIREKKAPQFVHAVLSIGRAGSLEFAPVEYGVLVNSITEVVDVKGERVTGELAYNANYAAALEFGTWKPVAAVNKEGPADNMDAKPHFLREGFESSESKTAIKQAESIFRI